VSGSTVRALSLGSLRSHGCPNLLQPTINNICVALTVCNLIGLRLSRAMGLRHGVGRYAKVCLVKLCVRM